MQDPDTEQMHTASASCSPLQAMCKVLPPAGMALPTVPEATAASQKTSLSTVGVHQVCFETYLLRRSIPHWQMQSCDALFNIVFCSPGVAQAYC